jgi:hypothetical protein
MKRWTVGVCAIGMGLAGLLASQGRAQFAEDARWVPRGANCLVLVSGERLFASPLAQAEGWADQATLAFRQGTSLVPAGIDRMLVATQYDLHNLEPIWSAVVLADSNPEMQVERLAAKRQRELDIVAGHAALLLENDVHLVQLAPETLGALSPADRQALGRWVDDNQSGAVRLAPYLAEAVGYADRNSDIIIAIDLQHAVGIDEARSMLKRSDAVAASQVESAAKVLSRLRGATLGIKVGERISGAIKVDFAPGTTDLELVTKEVLLAAIESQGVMIDDFRGWELQRGAAGVTLQGELSKTGLRLINALVGEPVQAKFGGLDGTTSGAESGSDPLAATRRYFDQIDLCFKELSEFSKQQGSKALGPYTKWFDSYANKIDLLPAAGVDAELLEYGGRMADGFRQISQTLTTANASQRARGEAAQWGGYGYSDGYYGYNYGYRQRTHIKQAIRVQEFAVAQVQANKLLDALLSGLGDLRRKLATKYGVDF